MTMTSWMGSAFTIDDLVKESFLTRDYSITTSFVGMRGKVAVYEYTLTPKPEAAVVWGKIILQIRQVNLMPAWQGYYDEDGQLVRELTFSDYKNDGRQARSYAPGHARRRTSLASRLQLYTKISASTCRSARRRFPCPT